MLLWLAVLMSRMVCRAPRPQCMEERLVGA
jgi:hypothetical protein